MQRTKRHCALAVLTALASIAAARSLLADDLVITEFMANNEGVILDEDGSSSDFVEIFNAGATPCDLDGWYLTDDALDLRKWRVPAVEIQPSGFLLVFASDKNRSVAGAELHTNFKLSSEGEYLGLIAPDGTTVVSEFAPYPEQVRGFSYGRSMNATVVPLVDSAVPARALVPQNGDLGLRWAEIGFDDSSWLAGDTGVGYDRNATYRPLISLDVRTQMENVNTTCYVRVPFVVEDPARLGSLRLRMKYDDGFVAYVNGTRVAISQAPGLALWNSAATAQHNDSAAVEFQEFSAADRPGLLVAGENVLAIHGLNANLGSSDFLVLPELDTFELGELERDTLQYFPQPTPGSGNPPGFVGIAEPPVISPPSRVFSGSVSISIAATSPDTVIRYTEDGTEPTTSSPAYTASLERTESVMVRARSFESDGSASPVVSASYVAFEADARSFSSDLPVVVVENFGGGGVPANSFQPCYVAIFEQNGGRTRLTDVPTLQTRAGIKIRGSSTLGRAKKAYAFEAWDEHNDDKDIAPLDLPPESDWILYGAYNFDRALIRNAFIYEVSNQVGRYAVRTRFCEVFVNTGGGSVSDADYAGVYSFMEKIKRGPDRVDIERLVQSHDSEPEITGGYMLKIDRLDPGDSGFNAGGQRLGYNYPKERDITPTQAAWIAGYIDDFGAALNGANFHDPELGYAPFIDVESWVDHHLLNEFTKNPDGLRLSTYLFKQRGGPLEYGPIWDFDRTLGPDDDGRAADPVGYSGSFNYGWWGRLFQDPNFWQVYKDRWHVFRQGPMSTSNLLSIVDSMANEIREAQARNFARWPLQLDGGWEGEIDELQNWISSRASWMDDQFAPAPRFSPPGGPISPGFLLTMSAPAGTIRYTLDGTDPRLPGGATSLRSRVYSAPIALDETTRVVARTRRSATDWSAPTAATFYTSLPTLVITELMYHPADPPPDSAYDADDFEFVEILNAGSETISISGVRLGGGVQFTTPPTGDPVLAPGEYALVVKNIQAFASRYDITNLFVLGEYAGRLENAGEDITLEGALGEPILSFGYSDLWYPSTDGGGESLVIIDPLAPRSTWGDPESWAPSSIANGTPGWEDPAFPSVGGFQLPGDSNQDGELDISDAFSLLRRLFLGGVAPPCDGPSLNEGGNLVVLDVNADDAVDVTDVVSVLSYLFQGGPPPTMGTDCIRIENCPTTCSR